MVPARYARKPVALQFETFFGVFPGVGHQRGREVCTPILELEISAAPYVSCNLSIAASNCGTATAAKYASPAVNT